MPQLLRELSGETIPFVSYAADPLRIVCVPRKQHKSLGVIPFVSSAADRREQRARDADHQKSTRCHVWDPFHWIAPWPYVCENEHRDTLDLKHGLFSPPQRNASILFIWLMDTNDFRRIDAHVACLSDGSRFWTCQVSGVEKRLRSARRWGGCVARLDRVSP